MAGVDLAALMRADEDLAERLDAEKRELSARREEVGRTVAMAETTVPEQAVGAAARQA